MFLSNVSHEQIFTFIYLKKNIYKKDNTFPPALNLCAALSPENNALFKLKCDKVFTCCRID